MWALVLAGGRSRRMGRPKGELALPGGTLLERVVVAARQVAEEVVLVGDGRAAATLGLRAAEDHQPDAGPLSALAGGLALCPEGLHLALACDMPLFDPRLPVLMEQAAGDAQVVVPELDGRRHPLCALYRKSCLEPARRCLARGERRMDDLLAQVSVRVVGPEDVGPVDLDRALTNVNTPEEYQQVLRALKRDNHG
jgi:molybdopterin-guanine dinucleotide biosynthesis protein A